jgi:hypothetical protein
VALNLDEAIQVAAGAGNGAEDAGAGRVGGIDTPEVRVVKEIQGIATELERERVVLDIKPER